MRAPLEVRPLPSALWAEKELAVLAQGHLLRELEPLRGKQGALIELSGRRFINFSSNDYLGLASDPRLTVAWADAERVHGVGAGASRLVVGDFEPHRALEAALARFERAESVLLFNSGYAANVGILAALVGAEDAIFSDALNHASLVDGCRLSRAKTVVYPHGDVAALERLLSSTAGRRKLVVTDSVFSMDGALAPLEALVALCGRHGAALFVDEAHATGVLGPTGAGLCEALGVSGQVDVRMGTLGKALGVFGAYAACSGQVRELLIQKARTLVFSTSLPPALCVTAARAVALLETDLGLRERLWKNIRSFCGGLRALGLPAEPRCAIFPVVMGPPERALALSAFLKARGLWVKAIRPPTVPAGTSRLRFALSAAHTQAHLDQALAALKDAQRNGLL